MGKQYSEDELKKFSEQLVKQVEDRFNTSFAAFIEKEREDNATFQKHIDQLFEKHLGPIKTDSKDLQTGAKTTNKAVRATNINLQKQNKRLIKVERLAHAHA